MGASSATAAASRSIAPKLLRGLERACAKRPVALEQVERVALPGRGRAPRRRLSGGRVRRDRRGRAAPSAVSSTASRTCDSRRCTGSSTTSEEFQRELELLDDERTSVRSRYVSSIEFLDPAKEGMEPWRPPGDHVAREPSADEPQQPARRDASGIGITRRNTTPGRRPVRQGRVGGARRPHPRQGRPHLRAARGRVPDDWSQTATNIVAQKYFRGKLGSPAARALGAPDDLSRRRHDHRAGAARTATSPTPRRPTPSTPSSSTCCCYQIGGLQLAGLVQRRLRGAAAVLAPASSSPSTTRWTRSSSGSPRRAASSAAAPARASTSRALRSSARAALQGRLRLRAGLVHARRRRLGRHDQVGRQDAPRGQDGRARRRSPRHRGVHLVQVARGGEGARARRRPATT